jgi:hypothetical protein
MVLRKLKAFIQEEIYVTMIDEISTHKEHLSVN